jgi:hypothetical protein
MGNLRQSMTEEEWNELNIPKDSLLRSINTDGEEDILSKMSDGVIYYGGAIPEQHIEKINHPSHYGGEDNPYEAIKVIEACGWGYGFSLGNAMKYIMRAGKKEDNPVQDLEKAKWYIERAIKMYKDEVK